MTRRVRETMADIERIRQMAAVGEFASQIAHEIRNPLTSIKLNMQKLERSSRAGRMPSETERPLEITLREIDRLDRVVHGVLQLGRARASSRGRVDLGRIVAQTADVARPQLERRGVQLLLRDVAEADGPEIQGDANLLSGALLNVMLNAGEASPAGGVVQVDLARNDTSVSVRVRDTGPGIPPDARERVFEPFYTTTASGTGLGLALAQRTVEEHGGTIRAEDVEPGASCVIELPLVAPEKGAHTV
jgi:signal transduction histidine kinase